MKTNHTLTALQVCAKDEQGQGVAFALQSEILLVFSSSIMLPEMYEKTFPVALAFFEESAASHICKMFSQAVQQ